MSAQPIVEIFRRVLEIDNIQLDSDFFLLGGDSLLATRVLSAIAREFGVELSLTDFLSGSSPQALALLIENVQGAVEKENVIEKENVVKKESALV